MWTSTEQAPERGLTYWESADRSDRRLLLNTGGGLRAIDATSGTLIKSFGKDGFVDMRTGEPRRLAGPNKTSRPHLREPDRCRIQHRRRLRIAARRSARLRRGHGPAGLDVPHHSASRRVRLRHVAGRRLEVRRRRQHVGRDHDRHEERHRVRPDRLADARPLRRGSRRRQPVWQLPARPRRADRQAALAFPDGAPRSVGLRPRRRAQAPHRAPRTASRSTSSRRRARRDSSTCSSG